MCNPDVREGLFLATVNCNKRLLDILHVLHLMSYVDSLTSLSIIWFTG
jgi:hypothetical protein